MKNQGKYLEEAKWIADLVIDRFSNQHAQIPTRINCNSGEIIDSMEMVDDLGDYVQYIYLLGKITDIRKYMDFSLKSVKYAVDKNQDETGLFCNLYAKPNTLDWYSNEDTFYGLTSLYFLSENIFLNNVLINYINGLKNLMHKSGLLFGSKGGLKKYISRTPITIVEGLTHLYKKNNNYNYIELAEKLVNPWIFSSFFKKYGLFPDFLVDNEFIEKAIILTKGKIFGMRFRDGHCNILKSNTNLMQGILELWKITGDDIYLKAMNVWINSIENHTDCGDRYSNISFFTNEHSFFNKPMFTTIHVLGFYCDYYVFTNNHNVIKYIDNKLHNIVYNQTKIGLFRVEPADITNDKYKMGWLDQQTDTTVVLLKGYQITGNKVYLDSAIKCVDAVIKYLKMPYGYIEYFDAGNGQNKYHSRLYLKFITLFIKVLILLDAVLDNKNIFKEDLFLITGDR